MELIFQLPCNNQKLNMYWDSNKHQYELGTIHFEVTTDLGVDGETNFGQRRRRCCIKIKRTVATFKNIC